MKYIIIYLYKNKKYSFMNTIIKYSKNLLYKS